MKPCMTIFRRVVMFVFCLSLVACVGRPSAPTQFYMLTPVPPTMDSQARVTGRPAVQVSLDPVEIPEYLNRPQIVTHLDGAEYHLDEFNRWLEPLGDNLTRVIAENLTEMLSAHRIEVLSMARPVDTDFSVTVQILQLDGKPGREMVLVARWTLFDQTDNVLSLTKRSVIKEKVEDHSYESLVNVQTRLIESLSHEIADSIRPVVLHAGS
jgi:uncharacterized protein